MVERKLEEEMVHGIQQVPQYFLRKLWADFVLGFHVNYFDITKFEDVSFV